MSKKTAEQLAVEVVCFFGIDAFARGAVAVSVERHEEAVRAALNMAKLITSDGQYYELGRKKTHSGKSPVDIILNGTSDEIFCLARDLYASAMPPDFFDEWQLQLAPFDSTNLVQRNPENEAKVIASVLDVRLYGPADGAELFRHPLKYAVVCPDVVTALERAVVRIVEDYDGDEGQMLLCRCLQDPSSKLRKNIATACARFVGYSLVSDALHGLRFDPILEVRKAALESLGRIRVSPRLAAHVADFIDDEDDGIRARAITMLSGFRKLPNGFDRVVDKALNDESTVVRALAEQWAGCRRDGLPEN